MDQIIQFVSNHMALNLAFLVVASLILVNELLIKRKQGNALTPQTTVDMINHEHAVVIDLRDTEAFNAGHIVDAIQAKEDDFSTPKMNKYKSKKLILVCANGLQSTTAAAKLRTQGYESFVLGGGITAWKNAELPLVKTK